MGRAVLPVKALGRTPAHLILASGAPAILVILWLAASSLSFCLFCHVAFFVVCVPVSLHDLLIKIPVIGFRTHPDPV